MCSAMQFAPAPSQSRSQEYDFARGLADEKVDVVKLPEHAQTLFEEMSRSRQSAGPTRCLDLCHAGAS